MSEENYTLTSELYKISRNKKYPDKINFVNKVSGQFGIITNPISKHLFDALETKHAQRKQQAKHIEELEGALKTSMGVLNEANKFTVENEEYRDKLDGLWVVCNKALGGE
jgi:hypothetical protein